MKKIKIGDGIEATIGNLYMQPWHFKVLAPEVSVRGNILAVDTCNKKMYNVSMKDLQWKKKFLWFGHWQLNNETK